MSVTISQPYLPLGRYQASLGHSRLFPTVSPAHTLVRWTGTQTPSPPYCGLDHCPSLADRFICGMAPIDYNPVVLRKPFRPHLTMSALPSEVLPLRPVRHYPHFWISTRGLGSSGTLTHLRRVLPGTHYELLRPRALHRYSHPCGASTWISPLSSERQVPTFHAKAWIRVTPPLCRGPLRQ